MAQRKIFSHFLNTITKLDSLINRLETNVGKAHSASPFSQYLDTKQQTEEKKIPTTSNKPVQSEQTKPQKEVKPQVEAKPKKEDKPAPQKPEEKKVEEKKSDLKPPTDEDFQAVDIRVGRIVECWKHPESENLYCEKIDIGTEVRQIASGLQKFQPIENMSGLVIVMANLKGRKLAGFDSNGMVVCASNADHTKVELLRPPADAKVGERVFLEGQAAKFSQDMQPVLNPKKKILETVLPGLKTDGECNATFEGKKWMTSTGVIKAQTLSHSSIS